MEFNPKPKTRNPKPYRTLEFSILKERVGVFAVRPR